MGIFKGGALRLGQTALYFLTFCCAAIIIGIFSFFLAVLADHNLDIPTKWKAVEGISGVIALYTICTTLLTCCLAGITFLSAIGLLLDILCMGGMIAIAVLTRQGAKSCSNYVKTPLGNGLASADVAYTEGNHNYSPNLGTACKLNKAVFAVAIAGAVLFLFTAIMQLLLMKHHKKEKRFGPGPDNDYTEGTPKRGLFVRKPKTVIPTDDYAEKGTAVPVLPVGQTIRPSHDTAYSGNTAVGANPTVIQKEGLTHDGHAPHVGFNPHERSTIPAPVSSYRNERSAATVPAVDVPVTGAIPSVHGGYYTTPGVNSTRDF
ncbi:hypothetical protein AUEXF2481DRAFT_38688 [Aureobasidium subglaciale EXF-2481]|uniref:MARVEL domain-containing protein n=1 Tax=Aureobasidium subglaciale (strain EXF-2481) TaxID=1043005 RepID=A0A074YQN7_AURSE|nr:uncharacterized protein AUEXF2481DRAFT_38688 [Aureobasidium subglaciale EXF-2481]KAI5203236.1 hypothetical protein E4T38_05267 [Aureobasidium subglaciale]KAI5215708.1 hypothetical protein E4T41_09485 [Aureobasidium subglaciale]KAI5220307.1 hypothetical protein E4T40_06031 [Aureobasidium subglaciale]KAI5253845.1 hypothetical protein E4T46_09449 [Aureobasidium subglaciale]KEQ96427.1 hypothetical protein AUEXF2481DRAFT_38688 [Aureobasidium subglaciale EXF-2481]